MSEKKTVLVVEDNEINRMILSSILEDDYHVLEAENGQVALDVLAEHKDEISLILLDIVMPVMDGHEFLSVFRKNPEYAALPVIVTTQSDSEADELNALAHGATDFVTKPYRPQVILHRVHSFINLRENAAMANQFRFDRLTGLYTQQYFYQRVREVLDRSPDEDFDIVCSDVENFKIFNDLFGPAFGDSLLLAIAQGYQEQATEGAIISRFHSDLFVVLTQRRENYVKRFDEVERLAAAAAQGRSVVIKWGVYRITDRSLPVSQMCDGAFLAVRQIKGKYGLRHSIYEETLRQRLVREQAITDCMEQALADGQFLVYFQPKYRLDSNRLCGAEALVRWNHPTWGFQSPGEFIPLFERNGFITQLDRFVWERTCMHLHEWDELGLPHIPVSVNVSRMDIYNADLEGILSDLVRKYNLKPDRLHLEITESAYTENTDQIIDVVTHLRARGFVIELDDFGTGYSSLSIINTMPMDIIKLDMRLVQSQTAQPENMGVLHFVMDLVRWMDLETVAEGVETLDQVQYLREAGCDIVQGYLLAKPMPVADFQALALKQLAENAPIPENLQDPKHSVLLVADEDPDMYRLVYEAFSHHFQVLSVPNKQSALDALSAHRDSLAAAIVSLTLPGPEEPSLFRILQWRGVPVVATAKSNDPWEEIALAQGAGDFLRRPYSVGSLRLRVTAAVSAARALAQEDLLRQEAYQDLLTGLLNRRGLERSVAALERKDAPLAVYMLDLDHLKSVNDALGHQEGDRYLKRFAQNLRRHTRQDDVLARYGGDIFVVVMLGITSEEQALKRGQMLCEAMQTSKDSTPCTAGVALCRPGESNEEMIRCADEALYRSKRISRGSCSL